MVFVKCALQMGFEFIALLGLPPGKFVEGGRSGGLAPDRALGFPNAFGIALSFRSRRLAVGRTGVVFIGACTGLDRLGVNTLSVVS